MVVEGAEQVGDVDVVVANVDGYILAHNVENLELGTGAVTGTGNNLDNLITGNNVTNTLSGGTGADTPTAAATTPITCPSPPATPATRCAAAAIWPATPSTSFDGNHQIRVEAPTSARGRRRHRFTYSQVSDNTKVVIDGNTVTLENFVGVLNYDADTGLITAGR